MSDSPAVLPAEREPRIFVADLLPEHFDDLAFLWEQRGGRVRSPVQYVEHLADADRRMEANVRGLAVGGRHATPLLLEKLGGEEPGECGAAAYALLRLGAGAAELITALEAAPPPRREALREALCQGPLDAVADALRERAAAADPGLASVCAEALAAHALAPALLRLPDWLGSPDPGVRAAACRLAARMGGSASLEAPARSDPDPGVRHEALWAAGWNREGWLTGFLRNCAGTPAPEHAEATRLFAVLAGPEDRERVRALAGAASLGPARFRALGASGDPGVVPALLDAMAGKEAEDAAAAATAYAKMTGLEVRAVGRAAPAAPPDSREAEFEVEVALPDAEQARGHWAEKRERMNAGARWCRGHDVETPEGAAALDALDLESRWEACWRGRFRGLWPGDVSQLELRIGRPSAPAPAPGRAAAPPPRTTRRRR